MTLSSTYYESEGWHIPISPRGELPITILTQRSYCFEVIVTIPSLRVDSKRIVRSFNHCSHSVIIIPNMLHIWIATLCKAFSAGVTVIWDSAGYGSWVCMYAYKVYTECCIWVYKLLRRYNQRSQVSTKYKLKYAKMLSPPKKPL